MKRYKNVLPLQPNQRNCSIRKTSLRRSGGWFYICGLFQCLDPFAQGIRARVASEDLAFDQTRALAAGREGLVCAAHAAAAGGGERNNGLAGQITAFQKRIDDGRRNIPPDGEADEDGVIVCNVLQTPAISGRDAGFCISIVLRDCLSIQLRSAFV